MTMSLVEQQCEVPVAPEHKNLLAHFQEHCLRYSDEGWGTHPVRCYFC